jgi:hypothetical protein
MRIGRLHIRVVKRRGGSTPAPFDAATCYQRLGELADTLHGHPWMVVSGLVEPLLSGRFSRPHGDIDIAVPVEHVEGAAAAVVRKGFILTTRVLRTHLGPRYDIEAHLRIAPGMLRWRYRRLRFWRLNADGELDESAFPPYVDLFPYILKERELLVVDTGWRLRFQNQLATSAMLPAGVTVPVEDPSHIKAGPGD